MQVAVMRVVQMTSASARALSFFARLACVTLLTATTFATNAAEKPFAAPQVADHAPVATAGSLAQVTLSLLLVLAAVFAAAWVVRRMRGFGKFGPNAIQIIADTPLGTKERAVLIQVGNQQLLLGVAPGQVSLLHVLAEPVGHRPQATGDSQGQGGQSVVSSGSDARPDFKAILKRSLGL